MIRSLNIIAPDGFHSKGSCGQSDKVKFSVVHSLVRKVMILFSLIVSDQFVTGQV